MTFKAAVETAPFPVNKAYRVRKQALAKYGSRVNCPDVQRLTGSVDLDSALQKTPAHGAKPRWDYGLGYNPVNGPEQAIWIEVHPATAHDVSAVLKKLQWLKDWLNSEAPELRRLTDLASDDHRFVWIASSRITIPSNSPQARRLSQSGLPRVRWQLLLP